MLAWMMQSAKLTLVYVLEQDLISQRDTLAQQLAEVVQQLQEAGQQVDSVRREAHAARKAADKQSKALGKRKLPSTSTEAAEMLTTMRQEAAAAPER